MSRTPDHPVPPGAFRVTAVAPTTSLAQRPLAGGAGGHGGNVWAEARLLGGHPDSLLDLSTNTFAAMAGRTAALLGEVLDPAGLALQHYPDPHCLPLRQALAEAEAVHGDAAPENVLPGNGAAEIIWASLLALRPKRALFVGPLFTEYARACHALNIPWSVVTPPETGDNALAQGAFPPDADLFRHVAASDADLVVACSPNNPGTAVLADPAALVQAAGRRALLLDVSYKDFLWAPHSAYAALPSMYELHGYGHLARAAERSGTTLALVGSLTKFYCCPGVRLGFLLGAKDLVARVEASRPAWTVSTPAERAGIALLAHRDEYRAALAGLRQDVAALADGLEQSGLFRSVHPGPSFAIAATAEPEHAALLRQRLLSEHRILVRLCDNIPGMPPGFLRIQARPEADMRPFWDALGRRAGLP